MYTLVITYHQNSIHKIIVQSERIMFLFKNFTVKRVSSNFKSTKKLDYTPIVLRIFW